MELGLYEEVITWCNMGLGVSFHKHVLPRLQEIKELTVNQKCARGFILVPL